MATEQSSEEQPAKKSSGRIYLQELDEGLGALDLSFHRLIISAFSAGLEISLSLFLIAIVTTQAEHALPKIITQLLVATMYSVGFIVVVLGRSELFTEQTTLAILPLLAGKTTPLKVGRLWSVVFVGNFLGAAAGAGLFVVIAPALGDVRGQVFNQIAEQLVHHSWWVVLLSAMAAGWLMGLASWLVAAARDTISQIILIWLFTASIGLGHLHHSVLGMAEMLGGIYSGGITVADFLRTLLFMAVGNALGGGLFVALLKFGHARRESDA